MVIAVAGWSLWCGVGMAQPGAPGVPGVSGGVDQDPRSAALERYLEDRGLWEVLAAHLRARMREGPAGERGATAVRLAKLYARLLGEARSAEAREDLEGKARELLKVIPEGEGYELRLDLAKASYLRGQEIAEKHRLRLASVEERSEAVRVLNATRPVFVSMAARLDGQLEELDRQERRAGDEETNAIRARKGEVQRSRSLAHYYAAWSLYYTAYLTGEAAPAEQALVEFGKILNAAPGRAASVDRAPKALMYLEHVARSAMGCALCAVLRGNAAEAQRWVEVLEEASDLPEGLERELFACKVAVLAGSGRWTDVSWVAERRRQPEREMPVTPLATGEARLLVVVGLEGARSAGTVEAQRAVAEKVAQMGFADLMARGEVSQVLDLVGRYGTAPIGESGFVVQYVRGLTAYEKARSKHKGSEGDAESPTKDESIAREYRASAKVLESALSSADAGKFEGERGRALTRRGLALYYAGDLAEAGEAFEEAYAKATDAEQRRDALWFAVVALDKAVEGGKGSLAAKRDRVSELYLQQFPSSENAARLVLRSAQGGGVKEEEALKVLLGVPEGSAIRDAARRQAAVLLYRAYRRAGSADKAFAAARFAEVAEGVVRSEVARARSGSDAVARDAAQNVSLLVRQLADALLSGPAPDVPRVQGLLDLMENVAALHRMDVSSLEGELAYRRLQIAVAREDGPGIEKELARLRRAGGEFSMAGDRLLYGRAVERWKGSPGDARLARAVVRHGLIVLERAGGEGALAVRLSVAGAAAAVWRAEQDREMLSRSIELDKESVKRGGRTVETLRRLAETSEAGGDGATALECWMELFAAMPADGDEWFEARYQTLRLWWARDPERAWEAMKQHKVLYPNFGKEPWGARIGALYGEMRARMGEGVK